MSALYNHTTIFATGARPARRSRAPSKAIRQMTKQNALNLFGQQQGGGIVIAVIAMIGI